MLEPAPHRYAVFAMLQDKDIAGVIAAVQDQIDVWLVAGIDAPRGASAAFLAEQLSAAKVQGEVLTFANLGAAVAHACHAAGENDRIAAFGSFYTVAAVLQTLRPQP